MYKIYEGDPTIMITTGSTLLDLAISGGRVRGGGIPSGILVEIFGPSQTGKTVLLCEIAGAVQRQGGEVLFSDPEARLNKQFAKMFGLNTNKMGYTTPDTIPEVFEGVRNWTPDNPKVINGIIADSLAALSTNMEMDKNEGDKMGMRRAKEFSEELRKTCRILAKNKYLMVCSNQIRQNMNAGEFGPRFRSPGGEAIPFYASLRLRTSLSKKGKIKQIIKVAGKEIPRIIGVNIEVEVFKSSVWNPYRVAPLTILFDYGIDNIRQNLQFIKTYEKNSIYYAGKNKLAQGMEESIQMVEEDELETILQEQTIDLWEDIESRFRSDRKPKSRD